MRGITISPVDRFGGAVVVTDIPTDLGSMVTLVPPSITSVPSESVTVLVSPSPTGPAGLIAIATNGVGRRRQDWCDGKCERESGSNGGSAAHGERSSLLDTAPACTTDERLSYRACT